MTAPVTYYIQGIGAVSPQITYDPAVFLDEPVHYHDNILTCQNPDFKKYINSVAIRRMSRILRIGMSAARICIDEAGLTMPDGIITATGYGCAGDIIKFLEEMIQNDEKQMTPTHFTQSTYNALSGAIALSLRCNNYNTTYVHRGFAVETALIDAMMQISDQPSRRFLVGGFDESDRPHYTITTRTGQHKIENIDSYSLFESGTVGTIQGEGAAFVALGTERTDHSYATLDGVRTCFDPADVTELTTALSAFLSDHGLQPTDIDLIVSGRTGCLRSDETLLAMQTGLFPSVPVSHYKHLVGDYSASSSFALWLASRILREQRVPMATLPTAPVSVPIRRLLYLNQYIGREYSMILMSALS